MKKQRKGNIGVIVFLVVDVLLLLIVVSVFHSLYPNHKPYDQIAVANLDKLASAIQKSCIEDKEQTISFELAQAKPLSILTGTGGLNSFINTITDIGKKSMLSLSGDPVYTIYYEAFPPRDAWTWEEYLEMPARAVVYYTEDKDELKNARNKLADYLKPIVGEKNPVPFVVSNIILDNVEERVSESFSSMFGAGSIGKWNSDDRSTKAFYGFIEFFQLSNLEKSMIKYRACGDNTLCMKTSTGIMRVPLRGCDELNADGTFNVVLRKISWTSFYEGSPIKKWLKSLVSIPNLEEGRDYGMQNRPIALVSPCHTTLHISRPMNCDYSSQSAYPLYEMKATTDSMGKADFELKKTGYYIDYKGKELDKTSKCIIVTYDFGNDGFCSSLIGHPEKIITTGKNNYVMLAQTSGSPHTTTNKLQRILFKSQWDIFWPALPPK